MNGRILLHVYFTSLPTIGFATARVVVGVVGEKSPGGWRPWRSIPSPRGPSLGQE